ncbi:MAG: hypothetical protein DMD62_13865 [Gemmatimonadetes bacterium]|nr:MAG: hypothetical protein DMD62_13865 [Gemmatimonadota bacterium]
MTPSIVALILANAFPVFGVLFLGWTVFPLLLLYWLENVVVGAFNVLKMMLAHPGDAMYWAGKVFLIPFFIVHFGGFTYVHGMLLFAFFGPKPIDPFGFLHALPAVIRANQLGWGVASLIASHGLSFFWNYLRNGEYQRASLQTLMGQPYGRVIVLHMTVLFGGWVVMLLGSPVGALIILIALKTAADVRGHTAERRRFTPAAATPPSEIVSAS